MPVTFQSADSRYETPVSAASPLPVTSAGVTGGVATASNPAPTRDYGGSNIATSLVTVGTSATQIVAARAGRMSVILTMVGVGDIFIGPAGVATGTGLLLVGTKGATITIPTQAAIFGIGVVAQAVSALEIY